MADTVIRNGRVVDGTGAPPFAGDVAIKDGQILSVGPNLAVQGAREIDAQGHLVTPGWIDPHTHYDAQMLWDPYLSPSTASGVTTLVAGNCAVTMAPCPQALRDFLIDLADSVEDIPANSIREAVKWEWESYPEYMACLAQRSYACDVGMLVGHSAIRAWVLGSRANASDLPEGQAKNPLTAEEIEKMAKVTEEAVAAGALGLSSSRVNIHRDPSGVLLPGSIASPNELLAMARGILRGGGGIFELASTWNLYDDVLGGRFDPKQLERYTRKEWWWLEKMATMAPDKLLVTTGMGTGMTRDSAWGHRYFVRQLEAIARKGGSIMGTPMMRMGGLNFSLASRVHPFAISRTFRNLDKAASGDVEVLARSMREPSTRAAIIAECEKKGADSPYVGVVLGREARYFLWPWSADYEHKREDSVAARAKREGKSMFELCYDILSHPEEPHHGVLWRALYNYGSHDMEPLKEMLLHPQVVPGFADGGAHMKMLCDATTATTVLTHFCRDRTRGEKLPIEVVVRKQTAETAAMIGLTDRGELVPGKKADINIIDFDVLDVLAPQYMEDLPLGAGRWTQLSTGYKMTICSGVVTFENGVATGALPGRIAKNPKATGIHGGLRGSVPHGICEGSLNSTDLKAHALALAAEAQGFSGIQKNLNAAATSSKL